MDSLGSISGFSFQNANMFQMLNAGGTNMLQATGPSPGIQQLGDTSALIASFGSGESALYQDADLYQMVNTGGYSSLQTLQLMAANTGQNLNLTA